MIEMVASLAQMKRSKSTRISKKAVLERDGAWLTSVVKSGFKL
jgi:hypothetical protein